MASHRIILSLVLFVACALTSSAQYWHQAPLPNPYDKGYYLDIFFLPGNTQLGWACDQHFGYVVRTTNGGASWRGVSVSGGQPCHLEYIQFLDADTGYASGPGGAFKSVDGGASWRKLTLPGIIDTLGSSWGGWFRTPQIGWILGGSCGYNVFLRTEDGGQTWNTFVDSLQKQSKLADPLWQADMPAGFVYAMGAGTLWKSTDDGFTWQVDARTGNTAPWHEEIARYGSSILVPNAASECKPGVQGAGMRFSVDNGLNWRSTTVLAEGMFGTWLIDAQTGWAAGYAGSVYYTSNAGLNWEKRNCGIGSRNMDDITFLDVDNGWVVGDGLFRLGPPKRTLSDSNLVFAATCPGQARRDTIYVTNLNFFTSPASAQITGTDADLFKLVPAPTQLLACAPTPIIIEYTAGRNGVHTALLRIDVQNPDTVLYVTLKGERTDRSAYPRDTLITFNARVGAEEGRQLLWGAKQPPNEYIFDIVRVSGDTNIKFTAKIPLTVIPEGSPTVITAIARDTGWMEATFKVVLGPCLRDTLIKIRVYGVTPILTSIKEVSTDAACDKIRTLRVPVRNDGNAVLDILQISIGGPEALAYKMVRWTSGSPIMPRSITPKTADTLELTYAPRTGSDVATLTFQNNDLSTTRGVKNPYVVALRGTSKRANIRITPAQVNLGTICSGATVNGSFDIQNTSVVGSSVSIVPSSTRLNGFGAMSFTLSGTQQRTVNFRYTPTGTGASVDTIVVTVTPCDSVYRVVVRAMVTEMSLAITPDKLDTSIAINQTMTHTAYVSTESDSVYVSSIRVVPALPNVAAVPRGVSLPVWLKRGQTIPVDVVASSATSTTIRCKLEAVASRPCSVTVAEDITIRVKDGRIGVSKSFLGMHTRCLPTPQRDSASVTLESEGAMPIDLGTPSIVGSPKFVVVSPLAPSSLVEKVPVVYVVEYRPTAPGADTATLLVQSIHDDVRIEVTLYGTYDGIGFTTQTSEIYETGSAVDFGATAPCDAPIDSLIRVVASGYGVDLELEVAGGTSSGGFELLGPWPLRVKAGDTAYVTARCTPNALSPGAALWRTALVDRTCGEQRPLELRATSAIGRMDVQPLQITLNPIEIGQMQQAHFTVTNPTNIPHTVTGFTLDPNTIWVVTSSLVGEVVPPGGSLEVLVEYRPTAAGASSAVLTIRERGECDATLTVRIDGRARDPFFPPSTTLRLRADEYIVQPSTQLSVPLYWDSDATVAEIDSVEIEVFVLALPFVLDTVHPGTIQAGMKYVHDNGTIRFTLTKTTEPLGKPGTFAVLSGHTRSSIPDSTDIAFRSVRIHSLYDVVLETDPGYIIVDACGPRFMIGFKQASTLQVQYVASGELRIGGTALEDDDVSIRICTLDGGTVVSAREHVAAGPIALAVPTGSWANGTYLVYVTTTNGGVITSLVQVVK